LRESAPGVGEHLYEKKDMRKKNLARYQVIKRDGVDVLVSDWLAPALRGVKVSIKRFLFFKHLSVDLEPAGGHFHGPACRH
jgi:hypothetical protein